MMRIPRSPSMLWALALVAMSGCAELIGIDDLSSPPRDAASSAPMDASIDSRDASEGCGWSPRPTHFDPCDLPAPLGALTLDLRGAYLYDTDKGTLKDPGGNEVPHASVELPGTPPVRAIVVDGLRVADGTRLRAEGNRPLLVASWSEIVVDGIIDVTSSNTKPGAGADSGECMGAGDGGQGGEGGGGGGGGGFYGNGGNGGNGVTLDNGGSAGDTLSEDIPATVRGGCPGARGGLGDNGDGRGVPSAGGGAVQLTAGSRIDIRGSVHANGAGGAGGCGQGGTRSGGSGGGSGGLIDLEAPTIAFGPDAIIAANGGGGGEGCQGEAAASGSNGQVSADRAQGGSGTSAAGGDGGDGSAGSDLDGTDGANGTAVGEDRGGGGGGGGGAGYIILDGDESRAGGAVLSPPPIKR